MMMPKSATVPGFLTGQKRCLNKRGILGMLWLSSSDALRGIRTIDRVIWWSRTTLQSVSSLELSIVEVYKKPPTF